MPIVAYDNGQLDKLYHEYLSYRTRLLMLQSLVRNQTRIVQRCHYRIKKIEAIKPKSNFEINSLCNTKQILLSIVDQNEQYIISTENARLATLKAMNDVKRQYKVTKKFLHKIKHDPHVLFDDLFANIYQEIFDYEINHAVAQTTAERIFWREIKRDFLEIPIIIFYHADGEQWAHSNISMRYKFAMLCGFLWEMSYRMDELAMSHGVVIDFPLEELLETTHILERGDLPKPFATSMSCRDYFLANRQPFVAISSSDLHELEKEEYLAGLALLNNNANGDLADPEQAELIAASIEKKVALEFTPDLKFYTLVLKLAHGCLKQERDPECAAALKVLAALAPGTPSRWSYLAHAVTGATSLLGLAASIYVNIFNDAYYSVNTGRAITLTALLAKSMFVATNHYLPLSPTGVSEAMHSVAQAGEEVLTRIIAMH